MKCRRSVACLVIWILLLTGQAHAEGRKSILERVYPNAVPPKAAAILVEPLDLHKSEGPCSLTVNEILFDGSVLYVHWTARSDFEPLLLFLSGNPQSPSLVLKPDRDYYDRLGLRNFVALGDTLNEQSILREYDGLSAVLLPQGGTLEPFDVTIQGFFLKPTMPVVSGSPYRGDAVSGPAWVSGLYPGYFEPYPDAATDDSGDQSESSDLEAYAIALAGATTYPGLVNTLVSGLAELGYAQLLVEINLTFTVTPDAEHIFHTEIEGQSTFEFDGYTVEFLKADCSATRFQIDMVIVEKKPEALSGLYYELWPDGNESRMYSFTRNNISPSGLLTIDQSYFGNSPYETPSFLLFKAYADPRGQGFRAQSVRVPERDITLKLTKVP